MMSEHITIATANTFYGQTLKTDNGLKPFSDADTDILLLQEVLDTPLRVIHESLARAALSLAAFDVQSGLAVATRKQSGMEVRETRMRTIQPLSRLGALAMKHNLPQAARLRPRAYLSATISMPEQRSLQVATTHPIVFTRPLARRRQLNEITRVVTEDVAANTPFVLAGDMNHYPGPRKPDRVMAQTLGLERVTLPSSTWEMSGSKHEWMARAVCALTRQPLERFDAELDTMLYSDGVELETVNIVDIASDHNAIISVFRFKRPAEQ